MSSTAIVRYCLPFAIQVWMYITPIIYPVSFIPERWRWMLKLNPMTGIIEGYRHALLGRAMDWPAFGRAFTADDLYPLGRFCALAFAAPSAGFADVI